MPRRFSEQEAQRIFARVAERQRDVASAQEGLSIEDLEEAARAAGLDPRLVASAAAELDSRPAAGRTLWGAPTEVSASRVIEVDLNDETWANVVHAARADLGYTGIAGQIGQLREWTVISGGRKTVFPPASRQNQRRAECGSHSRNPSGKPSSHSQSWGRSSRR